MKWPSDARYEELIVRHGRMLLRVAYLMTGSRSDAEDAVQEAIISTALRWPPRQAGAELAYLRRAVVNQCLDLLRNRRIETSLDLVVDVGVPDRAILNFEGSHYIAALTRNLPPRQRVAIVFRYVAQLDDGSIAQILSCRQSTVRSLIHRAHATMKAELNGVLER